MPKLKLTGAREGQTAIVAGVEFIKGEATVSAEDLPRKKRMLRYYPVSIDGEAYGTTPDEADNASKSSGGRGSANSSSK